MFSYNGVILLVTCKAVSPSPQLDSSGSTGELAGAYFRRDAPGRISIKKG